MKTHKAIDELLRFGLENEIDPIRRNRKILIAIAKELGDRDVRRISSLDIHRAADKNGLFKKSLGVADSLNWERMHASRYIKGSTKELPWELSKPAKPLIDLFKNKSFRPRRVLELGCGDGLHSIFMAKQGCQVTAVDISKLAVDVARKRAKEERVDCKFLVKDIFDSNADSKFDFVFDRGCFHHLPVIYYEKYKELVANALVPGGKFLLICHSQNTFPQRTQDLYFGLYSRLVRYLCDGISETGFSKSEIRSIFQDAFAIRSMKIIPDGNARRPFKFVATSMQKR